jgi:aryl carrier-like protein
LQVASINFDIAVWEIFGPLIAGARLVLAQAGGYEDPGYLVDLLVRERITIAHFVPTWLSVLLETPGLEGCESLRWLLYGGEASGASLPGQLWRRLRVGLQQFYGPTEASINVTCWLAQEEQEGQRVSLGRPIANTEIYLLDEHLGLVPRGVVGEVCIGGEGLAYGYLHGAERTAERFVPHPFVGTGQARVQPGARLYRTGDVARFRVDGALEFLGRIDSQVKLRGYRIELGEIEAALMAHPSLQDGVVVVREDVPGEKHLVAYLVARQGQTLSQSDLRTYLQARLPSYMIPSTFVVLEALPLTSNGKVDRRALPPPDAERSQAEKTVLAPRTAVEKALAAIWATLLRIKHVGIRDNFFELGGDSILSLQIIARAKQRGLHFTLKQLFQYQTIEQLSQVVQTEMSVKAPQGLVLGSVPLIPIQHWFFDQHFSAPHHWNQALFLQVAQEVHSAFLQEVVRAWLTQHDALRLRFTLEEGGNGDRSSLPQIPMAFPSQPLT